MNARGTRHPGRRSDRKSTPRKASRSDKPGCPLLLLVALPALVGAWTLVYISGRLVALGLAAVLAVGP